MESIAGWIAPAATMIAAMMTAANLGARITGWGFVVFVAGSISWCVVALASGQDNLLWSNAFLTLVNVVGVWRWLGRKARYEKGSRAAEAESEDIDAPSLIAFGSIAGAKLIGADGQAVGSIVDGMMRRRDGRLAYVVVTDEGVAGIGEQLYAVAVEEVSFGGDQLTTTLSASELSRRGPIEAGSWPARVTAS